MSDLHQMVKITTFLRFQKKNNLKHFFSKKISKKKYFFSKIADKLFLNHHTVLNFGPILTLSNLKEPHSTFDKTNLQK
jgi:hypothetical protein